MALARPALARDHARHRSSLLLACVSSAAAAAITVLLLCRACSIRCSDSSTAGQLPAIVLADDSRRPQLGLAAGLQAGEQQMELLPQQPPQQQQRASVGLISWHRGTIQEFKYVAQQLGVELTVSWPVHGYCPSRGDSLEVWQWLGEMYCKHYDAIVVIDTVPAGGRPFMEAFAHYPAVAAACRARRVVMLLSQRFDFDLIGDRDYYSTVQESLKVEKIVWAQNNPYEEWYMQQQGIQLPRPLRLLRPQGRVHGSTSYPDAARYPEPDPGLPVIVTYNGWPTQVFAQQLRAQGIDFRQVDHRRYGGAGKLAAYKCLIHLPYQVSAMAFYEHVAAGVVHLVPSPELMTAWCRGEPANETGGEKMPFPTQGGITALHPGFPWDRVEPYTAFFRDAVVVWDSWEDLRHKLATVDFAAMRQRAVALMDAHRQHVLADWRQVLAL